MRVLVFDDDAAIGRPVARVATLSGMQAMAVTDAEAFAQHLRSDPPQVIVLDLQLGDTDGVEQLRLLAARQYTGALVLMSGFDARVLASARAVGQSLGLKVEAFWKSRYASRTSSRCSNVCSAIRPGMGRKWPV